MSSTRRMLLETTIYTVGILLGMRYLFLPLMLKLTNKSEDKKKKHNSTVIDTIAKARGVTNLSLNSYEQTVAECLVNVENLDVDFSCIGGYEKVKKAVSDAILVPFKHPELCAILWYVNNVCRYNNPKSLRQPPVCYHSMLLIIETLERYLVLWTSWYRQNNALSSDCKRVQMHIYELATRNDWYVIIFCCNTLYRFILIWRIRKIIECHFFACREALANNHLYWWDWNSLVFKVQLIATM